LKRVKSAGGYWNRSVVTGISLWRSRIWSVSRSSIGPKLVPSCGDGLLAGDRDDAQRGVGADAAAQDRLARPQARCGEVGAPHELLDKNSASVDQVIVHRQPSLADCQA